MIERIDKTVDSFRTLSTFLHKKRAFLVVGACVGLAFLPVYLLSFNLSGATLPEIVHDLLYVRNMTFLLMLSEAALFIIWLVIRRIPRFRVGEIGVLVAVKTDDERLKIRLRDDFVRSLLAEMHIASGHVSVKILSEYHCERLHTKHDKAFLMRYHYTSRARLIVFGYADARAHQGQESYHLVLDESVSHPPIPQQESDRLAGEMIRSFPRETLIATNKRLIGSYLKELDRKSKRVDPARGMCLVGMTTWMREELQGRKVPLMTI